MSIACLDFLALNWQEIFQFSSPEIDLIFWELVGLYSDVCRHYHDLTHLQQVLEMIDKLCSKVKENGSELERRPLKLAAWFHDAIYDPRERENEQKSADYATQKLRQLSICEAEIERVRTLILCTQTHQARDRESQILLDADLAIFGAPSTDYWEYARAIRQEYAWASDRIYRAGRTRVLSNFLTRSRIYQTSYLFVELERQARINLQAEIDRLNSR